MAKNTGNGTRLGPVTNRTQTYNPKTAKYIKRGEDGKFMACKDTPFKSIRREENAKNKDDKNNNK
jgi:hypothetical protein